MTKDEALRKAIKQLEQSNFQLGCDDADIECIKINKEAIKACEEALAQQGYPLISLGYGMVEVGTGLCDEVPVIFFTNHGTGVIGESTVDEPRVNNPEDVYAAISIANIDSLNVVRKQLDIYASTYLNENPKQEIPKKEWQGLSDKEKLQIQKEHRIYIPTIEKIERMLKEKNG